MNVSTREPKQTYHLRSSTVTHPCLHNLYINDEPLQALTQWTHFF